MATYIGTGRRIQPIVETFVATLGQTTFNITYSAATDVIDVYQNGVRLFPGDYTATNSTTVILTSGCDAGDEITIVVNKPTQPK